MLCLNCDNHPRLKINCYCRDVTAGVQKAMSKVPKNTGQAARDKLAALVNGQYDAGHGSHLVRCPPQTICDVIEQRDALLKALQAVCDAKNYTAFTQALAAGRETIKLAKGE